MIKIKVDYADALRGLRLKAKEEVKEEMSILTEATVESLKAATPVDTGEAKLGWTATKLTDSSYSIDNDIKHIIYLNAGSSEQAPRNFIEQIMLQVGEPDGAPIVFYTETKK